MDFVSIMDAVSYAIVAALLGFVAYGGSLVLRGGRFHRDVPEDATHPRFDLRFLD
jgi:hypothetical protein